MVRCNECYAQHNRITPLNGRKDCLSNHLQYVCGTCGRCICINEDEKRGVRRWNFPFKSLDDAILYLRAAEYSTKSNCGIYEIENKKGRKSYKIFENDEKLKEYLSKNRDKVCKKSTAIFRNPEYREFPKTQVRYLSEKEIEEYLNEH